MWYVSLILLYLLERDIVIHNLIVMIQSNPNPKMLPEDVKAFRKGLYDHVRSMNSPETKRRRAEMAEIARNIDKNNGGKNAILGY